MEPAWKLAVEMRDLGFRLIDIAAQLYPREFEVWKKTRDRRLYNKLVKRVWELLRYAEKKGALGNASLEHRFSGAEELRLSLDGGERNPLAFREVFVENTIQQKKDAKTRADRQLYEYEQLIYRIYVNSKLPDPDGMLWATIQGVHRRVFHRFYERSRENVWISGGRRKRLTITASTIALAYAYSVISAALLLHGKMNYRGQVFFYIKTSFSVNEDALRRWIREIGPLILSVVL